jgi:predicted small secreted protein
MGLNPNMPVWRTHLVRPAMAAAAAITGRFADVRDILQAMAAVRWWLIGLLVAVSAGCNTAQGVKKDVAIGVEKTGEALQKSGEAVGNALNKTGDAVGGALKKSGEAVQKKVE